MPTPWPLSAPESLVLREGVARQGRPALKLALLELVGRRVLRVEHERRWYGGRTRVEAGPHPAPAAGALAGVARACLQEAADGPARLDRAVARLLDPHGDSAQRWLEREVASGLEARGLLASARGRVLGLFPRTTWTRTAAGDAAAAELEELVTALGRGLEPTTDPRDALALAAAAGAGVLLVQESWPLIEDLRRQQGDGTGAVGGDTSASAGGPLDPGRDAAGGGDGSGGPQLDLGALDLDLGGVGQAVDAVDAGVDAGGGGDGGDGGGGGD